MVLKRFLHYWLFERGIHRNLVYSPHNGPVTRSLDVFVVIGLNMLKIYFTDKVEIPMMTSSNGNIFRVTGPLSGEFTGEFPAQRPVTRSFMLSLICAWIRGWVNNREVGDLRRYRAHYDVIVVGSLGRHEAHVTSF